MSGCPESLESPGDPPRKGLSLFLRPISVFSIEHPETVAIHMSGLAEATEEVMVNQ